METVSTIQTYRNNRYDRKLASLIGIPGVLSTPPTTVRSVTPLSGDVQTFIIQTFRQRDESEGEAAPSQEYIFVEYVDDAGSIRIAIPPNVVRAIIRQHTSLSKRSRRQAAKAVATDRMARGIVPGFMRKK